MIKMFDIVIILIVAVLTFFSAYVVYLKPSGQTRVLIRGQSGEWVFPVEADETIVVSGPLGDTIARIHGNNAWIESSPCANQTCVAQGALARQGQWAACLPNNVLLIIYGAKDNDVDTVAW